MKDHVQHSDIVRRNLAYFWSIVAAGFLFVVLLKWGDKPEILTLLIGFILGGGIMGCIMGTFFNYSPSKPQNTGPAIQQADQVNVNNNPPQEGENTGA